MSGSPDGGGSSNETVSCVGVVLAAGRSSRMGMPKQLLPWGDTVVVGSVVEALIGGGVERVVLVRAPDDQALQTWASDHGTDVAVNPDPDRGMLSSVVTGIDALGGVEFFVANRCGLMVCPGDHAGLATETVRALRTEIDRGTVLAVPTLGGRRGHPLAISGTLVGEITDLEPTVGLRQLLSRHRGDVVELPVEDRAVTRDLDTPGDYRSALADD